MWKNINNELPKEDGEYYVCILLKMNIAVRDCYEKAKYEEGKWWLWDNHYGDFILVEDAYLGKVIAWQPLPQKYKYE